MSIRIVEVMIVVAFVLVGTIGCSTGIRLAPTDDNSNAPTSHSVTKPRSIQAEEAAIPAETTQDSDVTKNQRTPIDQKIACQNNQDCVVSVFENCCSCNCPGPAKPWNKDALKMGKLECTVAECTGCDGFTDQTGKSYRNRRLCPPPPTVKVTVACISGRCTLERPAVKKN